MKLPAVTYINTSIMNINPKDIPSYNLVLRNPFFGHNGHAQELIKCMLVQKIDDSRVDPGIEKMVEESEFDPDSEDIYMTTLIDKNDRGFSSVVNSSKRVDLVIRFMKDQWKMESIE